MIPSVERVRREVPSARVYHSGSQAIANATLTALALDSERFDNNGFHDTVTNNSRLTIPTSGLYMIGGSLTYNSNAVGHRSSLLQLNGATVISSQRVPATAADPTTLAISTVYRFVAGDYVELFAYQTSTISIDVLASGNFTPEFYAVFLGL